MPSRPGHSRAFFLQRVQIELAVRRMRDHAIRHALVANERGEGAGVDAGNADDAARFQPRIEVAARAIVRGLGDVGLQNRAACAVRRRHVHGFDVFVVYADVSNMRKREGDDLAGIGGVGEDFLIAGHRGVEAHLADFGAGRAKAVTFENRAVSQHQQGRGLMLCPAVRRLFRVHKRPK
jgi:hypothetical protein